MGEHGLQRLLSPRRRAHLRKSGLWNTAHGTLLAPCESCRPSGQSLVVVRPYKGHLPYSYSRRYTSWLHTGDPVDLDRSTWFIPSRNRELDKEQFKAIPSLLTRARPKGKGSGILERWWKRHDLTAVVFTCGQVWKHYQHVHPCHECQPRLAI